MTDLNRIILIGRLTRDLGNDERSFGYLQNGTARANVSIAVNRPKKQADGQWVDESNFFDVIIWGKTAENLRPCLLKGTQIAVDGYLKQDRWEKDGQKFSRISIVADTVQLCGSRKQENTQPQGNLQQNAQLYQQPQGYTQQQYPQSVPPNAPQYGQPVPPQGVQHGMLAQPVQQGGFKEDIPWENQDIPF